MLPLVFIVESGIACLLCAMRVFKVRASCSSLRIPFVPNFVSFAASIAELEHGEKSYTHSRTHSPSLFDALETKACASENQDFIFSPNVDSYDKLFVPLCPSLLPSYTNHWCIVLYGYTRTHTQMDWTKNNTLSFHKRVVGTLTSITTCKTNSNHSNALSLLEYWCQVICVQYIHVHCKKLHCKKLLKHALSSSTHQSSKDASTENTQYITLTRN